ncbi:MAG TPA: undecaprenyl-phosphate glucose phosphotransferase [Alphaproteobacteria bacterium]|nr:undecaprenyl-phosphate glucose phosphotransferase [Alphaproteobacteria bacterium]
MSVVDRAAQLATARFSRRLPGAGSDVQTILSGILRAVDILIVLGASLVAYWIWHGSLTLPSFYLTPTLLGALLAANSLHFLGAYSAEALRRPALQLGKAAVAWMIASAGLVAIAYLTSTSIIYSRGWAILWLALTPLGFSVARGFAAARLARWRRQGLLSTRIAVVGTGELAQMVARQLEDAPDQQYRIAGFFADPGEESWAVAPKGGIDTLLEAVAANQIDEILVALPWGSGQSLDALLRRLNSVPVNVRICPDLALLTRPVRRLPPIAGLPTYDLYERPLSGWNQVLKRIEDLVLAVLLIVTALPIVLPIALLIKLDSRGPILFRQRRYGFNNNEFTVYKFRTMRHATQDDQVPQAQRGDQRVTRIGAFLRSTSLDELPQLINVLRGEMSLVGPRPHAVAHNRQFAETIDDYLGRHRVKPGITGWAQVNGLRGETRTEEQMRLRVQHDLYYIDNWSLGFDLKILLLTLFVGFVHENAY